MRRSILSTCRKRLRSVHTLSNLASKGSDRAKLQLRLRMLLDKKRSLQSRATPASKLSSSYLTLDEGFRLFSNDLDKLQQFVEVNQTAFSKILKKVLSSPLLHLSVQR